MQYVQPVILLDAAHLVKLVYGGTLCIALVLSGAKEVYLIGFLIACNTRHAWKHGWTTFLTTLHEACPIVLKQNEQEKNIYLFVFILLIGITG